jgi:hypothetical protein
MEKQSWLLFAETRMLRAEVYLCDRQSAPRVEVGFCASVPAKLLSVVPPTAALGGGI